MQHLHFTLCACARKSAAAAGRALQCNGCAQHMAVSIVGQKVQGHSVVFSVHSASHREHMRHELAAEEPASPDPQ